MILLVGHMDRYGCLCELFLMIATWIHVLINRRVAWLPTSLGTRAVNYIGSHIMINMLHYKKQLFQHMDPADWYGLCRLACLHICPVYTALCCWCNCKAWLGKHQAIVISANSWDFVGTKAEFRAAPAALYYQ